MAELSSDTTVSSSDEDSSTSESSTSSSSPRERKSYTKRKKSKSHKSHAHKKVKRKKHKHKNRSHKFSRVETDSDSVTSKLKRNSQDSPKSNIKKFFRANFCELKAMVKLDLARVADELFSKNILSGGIHGQISSTVDLEAKASKLLESIKDTIEVSPEKLLAFLEILREEPSLEDPAEGKKMYLYTNHLINY